MLLRGHGPMEVTGLADSAFLKEIRKVMAQGGAFGDLYRDDPTANAATRAIYKNVQALPLRAYDSADPRTRKEATGANAKALVRLLQRPNAWTAARDLKKLMVVGIVMDGETNLVLRDAANKPVRDFKQRPMFITSHRADELGLQKIKGRPPVWQLDGKVLPDEALIQVKDPDPKNNMRGYGTKGPLRQVSAISWHSRSYLRAFFENGADAGGYLESPVPITGKQKTELLLGWEQRHRGSAKRHKVAILDSGLKYVTNTQSHVNMELLKVMDWSRITTLSVLGVPESEVAITSAQTYANGLSANAGFWFQTILPILFEIEEAWNDPVVGLGQRFGGLHLAFDLTQVKEVLKRVKDKTDALAKLVMSGVPINEAVAWLSMELPEVEGGHIAFVPANLVPLQVAGDVTLQAAAVRPPPAPAAGPPAKKSRAEELREAAYTRARQVRAASRVRRLRAEVTREAAHITREYMLDVRQIVLAELSRDLDQEQRVDPSDLPPPFVIKKLAIPLADIADEYVAAMGELYRNSVEAASGTVSAELGRELLVYDQQHPQIVQFVQRKTSKVRNVTRRLKRQLEEAVTKGVTLNEDVAGLKTRVRHVMNVEAKRVAMIARTEAGEAVNGGRFEIMVLEGVKRHVWSAFIDKETRESHVQTNGEEVPLGARFSNGLLYPLDLDGSAEEVIGCRCVSLALAG